MIPLASSRSAMLKPLSAMTASPGSSLSSSPDKMNSSLSDTDPPYKGEMNENAPHGVIPASAFTVL